ncbi:ribonuclease toxin HepT-like protein [Treponema sp. R80B11-R83G3]
MDEITRIKIEHEISRIEKSLIDVKPLLDLCKIKDKPDIIEMTAAAQVLHSFYNGVESVVILFLKSINEKIPNDNKWHKTLFEIMFGHNSKKIAIIRNDIKKPLEKYMYFRHFIRHSYSSELDWGEMEILVKNLEEIWKTIKTDFELFIKNN